MDGRRKPVLAASVAVFRAGKVLLAQRGQAPGQGLYSLPGGRVEPGETLIAAALRELGEEVGVTAQIIGFIDHVEYIERNPDGSIKAHAVVCAFAGQWVAGEPSRSAEASALLWVDPLAPPQVPMTRHLPEILARAREIVATG